MVRDGPPERLREAFQRLSRERGIDSGPRIVNRSPIASAGRCDTRGSRAGTIVTRTRPGTRRASAGEGAATVMRYGRDPMHRVLVRRCRPHRQPTGFARAFSPPSAPLQAVAVEVPHSAAFRLVTAELRLSKRVPRMRLASGQLASELLPPALPPVAVGFPRIACDVSPGGAQCVSAWIGRHIDRVFHLGSQPGQRRGLPDTGSHQFSAGDGLSLSQWRAARRGWAYPPLALLRSVLRIATCLGPQVILVLPDSSLVRPPPLVPPDFVRPLTHCPPIAAFLLRASLQSRSVASHQVHL